MNEWPPKDGDDLDNAISRLENIIAGWSHLQLPNDLLKGLSDVLDLLKRKHKELKKEP